ncbi:MAG: hypothetical protein WC250_03230 [Candidatus Paceibacterota bacterium]|jgi:hypothetical protein
MSEREPNQENPFESAQAAIVELQKLIDSFEAMTLKSQKVEGDIKNVPTFLFIEFANRQMQVLKESLAKIGYR